ncbi:MAG: hypothetical protein INH41_01975 [Myxococcaceae bacterium]|jgi:hypothetical protein|nr:hypothetical protein [Myxococcaceae bacterium]MCA3011146.1 hypothetical protein [Myxococcaceae bacterium]
MVRRLALSLLLQSACARKGATGGVEDVGRPVAAAAVAALDDCTLATPLVPGVPGSPGHLLPSERNPNGVSELAAHMRLMADDLGAARAALLDGGAAPPLWARHRKLRCSWPTSPPDRNEAYDAMAQAYLEKVRALDASGGRREAYAGVVAACRACHEQTCEGPIVVIDALALEPPTPR